MNMTVRPMEKEEVKYSYRQSGQICGQTGYIGYLRGYLSDSSFEAFQHSWLNESSNNSSSGAATEFDKFADEFDEVIESLKKNEMFAEMFKKVSAIGCFIAENPDYCIDGNFGKECGMAVITDDYTYLMRFVPEGGDYNMYFFCYKRNSLEKHMRNAESGIRFITSQYDELFRISDGEKILYERPGDPPKEMVCRYIASCHVEINGNIYHICQFAEMCENVGAKCTPIK